MLKHASCVPSHSSFSPLYQKDAERGVTFKIFYLPSHTQYVWGYVLVITCQVSVIADMKLWTKILRLVY